MKTIAHIQTVAVVEKAVVCIGDNCVFAVSCVVSKGLLTVVLTFTVPHISFASYRHLGNKSLDSSDLVVFQSQPV